MRKFWVSMRNPGTTAKSLAWFWIAGAALVLWARPPESLADFLEFGVGGGLLAGFLLAMMGTFAWPNAYPGDYRPMTYRDQDAEGRPNVSYMEWPGQVSPDDSLYIFAKAMGLMGIGGLVLFGLSGWR